MLRFHKNIGQNQIIQNVGLEGIKSLKPDTKKKIELELHKNAKIQEMVKKNLEWSD